MSWSHRVRPVIFRLMLAVALFVVVLPLQTEARAMNVPMSSRGSISCPKVMASMSPVPMGNFPVATLAVPFAQGSCPGVRPGAMVMFPGGLCTFNFVFRGSDRRTYIGTAGHCPLNDKDGEKRWTGERGPGATDIHGYPIGHFVYAGFNWTGNVPSGLLPGIDFALIRLDPGVRWSAQMCHFGGPDGMYQRHDPNPSVLEYFGQSPTWRSVLPARTGIAVNTMDPTGIEAVGIAAHGDSGSGVINQAGEAVGVLTGAHGTALPGDILVGDLVIARLDVGVARAQRVLRIRLTLLNAAVN